MLSTAAGRAYLAFCDEAERCVHRSDGGGIPPMEIERHEIRNMGYSINNGDWAVENKFGALAVPLMHDGRVLLCLGSTFLRSTLENPTEVTRIANALLEARQSIEQEFLASTEKNLLF